MSVLLFIEEDYHRNELRRMLIDQLHFKNIFEASSAENAINLAIQHASSLKLIIGAHLPGDLFCDYKSLNNIPLVEIWRKRRTDVGGRTDAYIAPPFSVRGLRSKIFTAMQHRSLKRNTLLIASKDPIFSNYHQNGFVVSQLTSPEKLAEALESNGQNIGCLVIDTRELNWINSKELEFYRKTPLGCFTEIIGLGNSPESFYHFRNLINRSFAIPNSQTESNQILHDALNRMQNALQLRYLSGALKNSFTLGDDKVTKAIAQEFLNLDPSSPEALCFTGDYNQNDAVYYYQRAIQSNLCNPQAYLRLLKKLGDEKSQQYEKTIQQALAYCPKNPALNKLGELFNKANSSASIQEATEIAA